MTEKPNFLFVQADQLAARALAAYGNPLAKTPHMDALAARGVVFENAFCNYPLCAPSRHSMMSGLLASNAGAYDNGAEFPAALPTFLHYLRFGGYQTCPRGQDALHRARPTARLRGTPDDGHLPVGLQLDGQLDPHGQRHRAPVGGRRRGQRDQEFPVSTSRPSSSTSTTRWRPRRRPRSTAWRWPMTNGRRAVRLLHPSP